MKWIMPIMVFVCCNGCAFATLPAAKFTVYVTDMETGLPVTNAVIQTEFEHQYDPFNSKQNKVDQRKVQVDENGLVVLEGKDLNGSIGATIHADGYYQDWGGLEKMQKNIALNRWEPWDSVIEVKMREIKNPAPMIYSWIQREKIPLLNQSVGFDFETKDWVAPYGKGRAADIIFTPMEKGKPGIACDITFANKLDGIQEYVPAPDYRSSYIFPYMAPTNGYRTSLFKEMWYENNTIPRNTNVKPDEQINYIFRVRTVVDKDGKIISANYGRIQGDIRVMADGRVWFKYWFNPEPNSRSLESDKKPY